MLLGAESAPYSNLICTTAWEAVEEALFVGTQRGRVDMTLTPCLALPDRRWLDFSGDVSEYPLGAKVMTVTPEMRRTWEACAALGGRTLDQLLAGEYVWPSTPREHDQVLAAQFGVDNSLDIPIDQLFTVVSPPSPTDP